MSFGASPFGASPFGAAAGVSDVTYIITACGAAAAYQATSAEVVGLTAFYNAYAPALSGLHGVTYRTYFDVQGGGDATLYRATSHVGLGLHNANLANYSAVGVGECEQLAGYAITAAGAATLYGAFVPAGGGQSYIAEPTYIVECLGESSHGFGRYSAIGSGQHTQDGFGSYQASISGAAHWMGAYLQAVEGRARIANDALNRYELFIGTDAAPDFDAAAAETFTSLPHDTAALATGHVYQLVLRKRNAYNLSSQNIDAWTVDLSAGATAAATVPSSPTFSAAATAGGTVTIRAEYLYPVDGDNAADTYLVYYTTNGSAPDPETDTPIEVLMRQVDGIARLAYTTAALADATVVKALVRVRRSGSPDVDSINTASVTVSAETSGPAAPVGDAFFGKTGSQA